MRGGAATDLLLLVSPSPFLLVYRAFLRIATEFLLSVDVQFANAADVMRRAIALAARGIGSVEPNPAVGAVIVDDQLRLVGEGWHERFGGPHAEVVALAQAGEQARGATLY